MRTFTVLLFVTMAACSLSSSPSRPATALELCEQLLKRTSVSELECVKVTDADQLNLLQAVEGATMQKRGAHGRDAELGWVAFLAAGPDPTSMSGMMQLMGRQFAGLALLEAHNDRARVGVFFRRGEIGADAWDDITSSVTSLAAR
jgi:hypothetical protein